MFQSYVKYLLILTTTVEITILGVTLTETSDGIIQFQFYLKITSFLNLIVTLFTIVYLFTVSIFNLGTSPEMQLVPEPIFTVATDGIGITTIANTNSGRIFLGGRNGSLYEIYYQVKFAT